MSNEADVLLTYGWCRSSYAALRGLAQEGVRVVAADHHRTGMCRASRLAHARARYASPHLDPAGFVSDIERLSRDAGVAMILPGHDEGELLAEARDQGRFDTPASLPLASSESLALVNDKHRMTCFAEQAGVPVAPMVAYTNVSQLAGLTDPERHYIARARRGNSSKGVRYSRGGASLGTLVRDMQSDFELDPQRLPVVQEVVGGEGWGVSCLYWHGQALASFTHRRLQEKVASGGTSTLRISDSNPLLESYAHTLLERLQWHGLAMIEFKYEPTHKQGYFIEINPRLWGSFDLALSSGVNFAYLLYLAQTQGPEAVLALATKGRDGVVAKWLLGDIIRRLTLARQRQFGAALSRSLPGQVAVSSYDDIKRDDPWIFCGEAFHYLAKGVSSFSLNPREPGMVR
ncbi:ATP-grasp domain-containing protein [Litchfieldella xinjiangensis]|uniref:carboxylate--amine ligase n=1 Tax=Litchfieldella xinjiangensis TaxID=1166948 RepID=UPI0005B8B884|nr:ATP-grasp domain-containing protein [Halomonas xinjiangensis]